MSEEWTPYIPPWYDGGVTNPWATDPATYQQGHETFYATWCQTLAPGELERRIKEHRNDATG